MFESTLQHGTYDKKTLTVAPEPGFDDALFVTINLDMHGDTVSVCKVLDRHEVQELRDKLTAWLDGSPDKAAGPALRVVE